MPKRLFDFTVSAVGVTILLPAIAAIAIAIVLESGFPVFFQQVRVGRHERLFEIYKFRTMFQNSELGGQLTLSHDKRVTKVGKWLRQYKLDELPQLVNVLRGEMSLVGPRPEVPKYVAYYTPADKACVFSVRPGITDSAALEFRRESELLTSDNWEQIYINELLPAKLARYREYAANATLKHDIGLILKTVRVLFFDRG